MCFYVYTLQHNEKEKKYLIAPPNPHSGYTENRI